MCFVEQAVWSPPSKAEGTAVYVTTGWHHGLGDVPASWAGWRRVRWSVCVGVAFRSTVSIGGCSQVVVCIVRCRSLGADAEYGGGLSAKSWWTEELRRCEAAKLHFGFNVYFLVASSADIFAAFCFIWAACLPPLHETRNACLGNRGCTLCPSLTPKHGWKGIQNPWCRVTFTVTAAIVSGSGSMDLMAEIAPSVMVFSFVIALEFNAHEKCCVDRRALQSPFTGFWERI